MLTYKLSHMLDLFTSEGLAIPVPERDMGPLRPPGHLLPHGPHGTLYGVKPLLITITVHITNKDDFNVAAFMILQQPLYLFFTTQVRSKGHVSLELTRDCVPGVGGWRQHPDAQLEIGQLWSPRHWSPIPCCA